jgi:hypothetical protein
MSPLVRAFWIILYSFRSLFYDSLVGLGVKFFALGFDDPLRGIALFVFSAEEERTLLVASRSKNDDVLEEECSQSSSGEMRNNKFLICFYARVRPDHFVAIILHFWSNYVVSGSSWCLHTRH